MDRHSSEYIAVSSAEHNALLAQLDQLAILAAKHKEREALERFRARERRLARDLVQLFRENWSSWPNLRPLILQWNNCNNGLDPWRKFWSMGIPAGTATWITLDAIDLFQRTQHSGNVEAHEIDLRCNTQCVNDLSTLDATTSFSTYVPEERNALRQLLNVLKGIGRIETPGGCRSCAYCA